jgi:hypothetical protein
MKAIHAGDIISGALSAFRYDPENILQKRMLKGCQTIKADRTLAEGQ